MLHFKLFLFFVLFFITTEQDSELFFYLNDPTDYHDESNHQLQCVGGLNPPSKITVTFKEVTAQSTTSSFDYNVKDIQGSKLINTETRKEIPLLCSAEVGKFVCECNIKQGEQLEEGHYYFKAEEIASGTPIKSSIREFSSENVFPVVKKFYTTFPFRSDFVFRVEFVGKKQQAELFINYRTDILEPPVFGNGKKNFTCSIDKENKKKLICGINKEDFPPSEDGKEYKIFFYNVCGQIEGSGRIINILTEEIIEENDLFMSTILPCIIVVVIIISILVVVMVIKINKDKGERDLGAIMKTSYADGEEKDFKKKGEDEEEHGTLV